MKIIPALLFFFVLSAAAYGQRPVPTPDSGDNDVVKITTSLVQFDAVVTDKEGKQITDLSAADFEILQDGRPQKITEFSYVSTESPDRASVPGNKKADKNAILPPPTRTNAANAKRILTFVVDDGNCAASMIGVTASREALVKFVNEQMLPDDLVAIYQTRSGSSVFQQYTSDRSQLLRAARKIRWYPAMGGCATSDGSFNDAARNNTLNKPSASGGLITIESEQERKNREASEDFSRNNQVVGTIGVLRYVIRGLEEVGGRKVVFLLSDGIPIRSRDGKSMSAIQVLRDLTDFANRSSVVLNTVDARGAMNSSMIEARDEVSTVDTPAAADSIANERERNVRNTRDGLAFIADETGGNFYRGQNFLDVPVRRALSLEKGYYLLAYEPDDNTFKGKKFNSIEIKSRRPGLKVLSRAGFVGSITEAAKQKKRTGDSELYEAIVAPLPRSGLNLQLTAFFGNAAEGNFVRSMTHLKGEEITFVNDSKGFIKAVFDVVAVTLDEKNEVVDEFTRTHTFKIEAGAMPLIKQNGLIYTTDVPIKKAGTYNFRVAVRDATSKLLGSAGQIVQIPDLKKGKLFLSALTVTQVSADGKFSIPAAVNPENALSITDTTAVPAIRRFRRGSILAYAYTIYNARLGSANNKPNLSIQMNLYRNGVLISEGNPAPADLETQADWSRINDYAYFRLKPEAEIGDYALQIIVKDNQAGNKNEASSQWIDFEVVE